MISRTMQDALNEQIKWEFYSAYLYLSMSACFEAEGLAGFANWMRVQAQEELTHGMRFYSYVNSRGGRVLLQSLDGPPTQWDSPMQALQDTLEHERIVTSRINDLVRLALSENDHATHIFLQWFVTEQVEEEASATEILQKLKLMGEQGNGLFMLDRELALRRFVMPAAQGET